MKVLLFDVYETLLTGARATDPEPGMRDAAADFGLAIRHASLAHAFHQKIRQAHRDSPHPHPEIDVRAIWHALVPELRDPDAFALAVEERIRPVRPMPGSARLLEQAAAAGLRLGLVSNAQAYTRTLLDRHFGLTFFDARLLAFSYEHGLAKPDQKLFEHTLAPLDEAGIPRRDTLMIGDSEPNDIHPARTLGLSTFHVPPAGPLPDLANLLQRARIPSS